MARYSARPHTGGPVRPFAVTARLAARRRQVSAAARSLNAYVTFARDSGSLPFVHTYQYNAWTALGDPTRKAIFELLAERPRAVGELASELPVSRPAVSQHLKVLKEAGLVVDRQAGTRRVYRVDPDGLSTLRDDLERFWEKALAAYKSAVEQEIKEER